MFSIDKVKILEEHLRGLSIVDLLEEWGYTSLSNKYNCPMHDDEWPSMFVDHGNNVWFCHSCQKGGGSAKLIHEYFNVQYGTKLYYNSLEKYLELHRDVCNELGFTSMKSIGFLADPESLGNIISSMTNRLESTTSVETVDLKLKPDRNTRNIKEIIEYVVSLQEGYK